MNRHAREVKGMNRFRPRSSRVTAAITAAVEYIIPSVTNIIRCSFIELSLL
jgi:hypothetical protein